MKASRALFSTFNQIARAQVKTEAHSFTESKRVHFCLSVSALRAQSRGLNEQSALDMGVDDDLDFGW